LSDKVLKNQSINHKQISQFLIKLANRTLQED